MFDEIVAHTVIRMTLAYFRANDTRLKKQNFNPLKPSGAKWLHLKASSAILV